MSQAPCSSGPDSGTPFWLAASTAASCTDVHAVVHVLCQMPWFQHAAAEACHTLEVSEGGSLCTDTADVISHDQLPFLMASLRHITSQPLQGLDTGTTQQPPSATLSCLVQQRLVPSVLSNRTMITASAWEQHWAKHLFRGLTGMQQGTQAWDVQQLVSITAAQLQAPGTSAADAAPLGALCACSLLHSLVILKQALPAASVSGRGQKGRGGGRGGSGIKQALVPSGPQLLSADQLAAVGQSLLAALPTWGEVMMEEAASTLLPAYMDAASKQLPVDQYSLVCEKLSLTLLNRLTSLQQHSSSATGTAAVPGAGVKSRLGQVLEHLVALQSHVLVGCSRCSSSARDGSSPAALLQTAILHGLQTSATHTRARALHLLKAALEVQPRQAESGAPRGGGGGGIMYVPGYGTEQWAAFISIYRCQEEHMQHLIQPTWQASFPSLWQPCSETAYRKAGLLSETLAWTSVLLTRSCSHSNVGVRQMGLTALFNSPPEALTAIAQEASSWAVFFELLQSQLSVLENEKLLPGQALLLDEAPSTRHGQQVHNLCDALATCVSNCLDALATSDTQARTTFVSELLNVSVCTVSKRAVTAVFLLEAIARALESKSPRCLIFTSDAAQSLFVPLLASVTYLRPAWRLRQVVSCLMRIITASTPARVVSCQLLLQILAAADPREPHAVALSTLTSIQDNLSQPPGRPAPSSLVRCSTQAHHLPVQQISHGAAQAVRISGPGVSSWIELVLLQRSGISSSSHSQLSQWIASVVGPQSPAADSGALQHMAALAALLPHLTPDCIQACINTDSKLQAAGPLACSPVQVACHAILIVGLVKAVTQQQEQQEQQEVTGRVAEHVRMYLRRLVDWWWHQGQDEAGKAPGCAAFSTWPVLHVLSAHTWLATAVAAAPAVCTAPDWAPSQADMDRLMNHTNSLSSLDLGAQVWLLGSLLLTVPASVTATTGITLDIARLLNVLVDASPPSAAEVELQTGWQRLRCEVVARCAGLCSGASGYQLADDQADHVFNWCLTELEWIDADQDSHALQRLLDVLLVTAPWSHLQEECIDVAKSEASVRQMKRLLDMLPGLIRGAGGAPLSADVATRVVSLFFHPSLFSHTQSGLRQVIDIKLIPLVLSKGGPRLAVALLTHLAHHVLLPTTQLLRSYLPHVSHLIAFSLFSCEAPTSAAATAAARLDPALTLLPKVVLCGHLAALARSKSDVSLIQDLMLGLLFIVSGGNTTSTSSSLFTPDSATSAGHKCAESDYSWMASRESGTESVTNGVRVSCWQALSLLAPHLDGAAAQQALHVSWQCLMNPYQHANVRSHIQLVVLTLLVRSTGTQQDGVLALLLPALHAFNERKYQVVVSVVIVALFYVMHVGPDNQHFKPIMHALLPWSLHHRHAVRVPVQVLLHAILDKHGPAVWAGSLDCEQNRDNVNIMTQVSAFLTDNPEMCVLRERQGLVNLASFDLGYETSLAGVFGVRHSDESDADGQSEVTGLTWHVHVRDRLPMDLISVLPGALRALGHSSRSHAAAAAEGAAAGGGQADGHEEAAGGDEDEALDQTEDASAEARSGGAPVFQQLRPQLAAQAVTGHGSSARGNTHGEGVRVLSDEVDHVGQLTAEQRHARQAGLIVCASLLDNVPNMAGLCRTCESLDIEALVLPSKAIATSDAFKKQSVTSERWLKLLDVAANDVATFLRERKALGYTIIGLEQATGSTPLQSFSWPRAAVLLLGNEQNGVPANLLPLLDQCVEIPMLGTTRSLNVHVSGALSVWQYTQQWALPNEE